MRLQPIHTKVVFNLSLWTFLFSLVFIFNCEQQKNKKKSLITINYPTVTPKELIPSKLTYNLDVVGLSWLSKVHTEGEYSDYSNIVFCNTTVCNSNTNLITQRFIGDSAISFNSKSQGSTFVKVQMCTDAHPKRAALCGSWQQTNIKQVVEPWIDPNISKLITQRLRINDFIFSSCRQKLPPLLNHLKKMPDMASSIQYNRSLSNLIAIGPSLVCNLMGTHELEPYLLKNKYKILSSTQYKKESLSRLALHNLLNIGDLDNFINLSIYRELNIINIKKWTNNYFTNYSPYEKVKFIKNQFAKASSLLSELSSILSLTFLTSHMSLLSSSLDLLIKLTNIKFNHTQTNDIELQLQQLQQLQLIKKTNRHHFIYYKKLMLKSSSLSSEYEKVVAMLLKLNQPKKYIAALNSYIGYNKPQIDLQSTLSQTKQFSNMTTPDILTFSTYLVKYNQFIKFYKNITSFVFNLILISNNILNLVKSIDNNISSDNKKPIANKVTTYLNSLKKYINLLKSQLLINDPNKIKTYKDNTHTYIKNNSYSTEYEIPDQSKDDGFKSEALESGEQKIIKESPDILKTGADNIKEIMFGYISHLIANQVSNQSKASLAQAPKPSQSKVVDFWNHLALLRAQRNYLDIKIIQYLIKK